MRKRTLLILGSLACAVVIALFIWRTDNRAVNLDRSIDPPKEPSGSERVLASDAPSPQPSFLSKSELKQRMEARLSMAYNTPIEIFGEVVDETGAVVPQAKVVIGIADTPLNTGSKYTLYSNADGAFSLTGVRGIAFSLQAAKDGYYSTKRSTAHRNVVVPVDTDAPEPTEGRPITLVLRKQGEPIHLDSVGSRQIDMPPSGETLTIDLSTGQTGRGSLHITSSIGDVQNRPFDWSYDLSVPGGGLIERNDKFAFEAPVDGYQEAVETSMPATASRWTSDLTKDYFVKLPDGKYGRFAINFYPGKRNFVVVESYVNPTPGSRNLEPIGNR